MWGLLLVCFCEINTRWVLRFGAFRFINCEVTEFFESAFCSSRRLNDRWTQNVVYDTCLDLKLKL